MTTRDAADNLKRVLTGKLKETTKRVAKVQTAHPHYKKVLITTQAETAFELPPLPARLPVRRPMDDISSLADIAMVDNIRE